MMNNLSVHSFQASYDYGPQEERIKKPNAFSAFINDLVVRLLKSFIYPAAANSKHKIIDPERIENARNQLVSIGGQTVAMTTPDGDKIDGMYLDAKSFKAELDKYCILIEVDNGDGTVKQTLQVKPEFCQKEERKRLNDERPFIYMQPNEEAQAFLQNMKGLGLLSACNALISKEENIRGNLIELGNLPKDFSNLESHTTSSPTALISPGSAMSYAAYKGLAAAYLVRGINVMMVDFRGYGKSEGSPTDVRTKLDLETAYQYLQTKHGLKNEDLIVHGHCLGGGPASDLAARRPGVNLILDRTFADYREVAREKFPVIRSLIHAIMPSIVNYNNAENLRNVKGNVAIAMAVDDSVIPEEQITKLIDNLPESQPGKHYKLMDTKGGHTGLWTDHAITSQQFDQFLDQTGMRRKLFSKQ